MKNKIIEYLKDKNILILGFGKEGRSTYNFIRKNSDCFLTVFDEYEIKDKPEEINTKYIVEKLNKEILEKYDLIIKSPGISLKNIDTQGLNISSQLQLILMVAKDNIIGITGTKGKSTTSSLMYKVIKDQYENTFLLGNIGIPILDYIDSFNDKSKLVIELSCHQLEYVTYSPHISIILNLFKEHLDFYKDVESYYEAKMNITKFQNENDYLFYNFNNNTLKDYVNKLENNNAKIGIGKDIYIKDDYVESDKKLYNISNKRNIVGDHNLENIMFILGVSDLLNLDMEIVSKSIEEFQPLEHRMELVGTFDNIIYYNDSIATIPEATINCVETLKIVDTLILGGNDRSLDYKNLIEYLKKSNISNIICLPKTGHDIAVYLEDYKKVYIVDNLEEAIEISKRVTEKNKICALSPAASSYGYFKNFEERGKIYKELVRRKK
ncbi:MAG: UDP-N-acetylmuramoyl-L-alanine--D-glutamate ligase [Bacilli bacterium]|nr:UDP-N-acetylmuramoyl-L-alanine--D-glutamate ligase [Bacilli bacterium]MDD4733863.1 UDP-N-acetylmuramoyl-L-alanine--D-glutamate ligase [Bacilli bacterium]